MKKFRIVREPIEFEVGEIIEVSSETNLISGERRVVLDNLGSIWAWEHRPNGFAIGDLVKYNAKHDHYMLFDPTELPPYSALVEIK